MTFKSLKDGRLEETLQPFLVTEEEDGGNHVADGDHIADSMDEMDSEALLRQALKQDEEDIENDASLSGPERDTALEAYQERRERIAEHLGLDGDEEEDEEQDEMYQQHLHRLRQEQMEVDGPAGMEELEELEPESNGEEDIHRKRTEL